MSGGRTRALMLSVGVAIAMIAQQLAGKAVRDAYFLTEYPSTSLPTFTMIASVLSIGSVLGTGALYRRVSPRLVLPVAFAVSGGWFVLEWALAQTAPKWAAASLFIHTSSFGAIVVSGFWSVVNEAFDPHSAKKAISRIAGGATLGGVLGGLAAWGGAARSSVEAMIFTLGVVNVACALMVPFIRGPGNGSSNEASEGKPAPSAFSVFEETPYLRHVALLVGLAALGAAAFDYVFKARAAETFTGEGALVEFFSQYYLALAVVTFLFQLVATRTVVKLGLSWAVAVMPGAVAALSGVALLLGGFVPVLLLRGGAAALESSIHRSSYEMLFTPLPPEKKRPTKTLIDVGGDKLGAALGGGLVLGALEIWPKEAERSLLVFSVLVSLVALAVARKLHQGYIGSLADNLRSGLVSRDSTPPDRVSQSTLEATLVGGAREAPKSLATLSQRPMLPRSRWQRPRQGAPASWAQLGVEGAGGVTELVQALGSDDRAKKQVGLRLSYPLDLEVAPHVAKLLADPELAEEAQDAFIRTGPRLVGFLTDILVGATNPMAMRSRVPRILARIPIKRSLDGLGAGLEVESLPLRYRVAEALWELSQRQPGLVLDQASIEASIGKTAEQCRWQADGRERTLAFAHLMLSTMLPGEPLRLALAAVAEDDPGRRGTGLEYMDNVLPKGVQAELHDLVREPKLARRALDPRALAPATEGERMQLEQLVERLRRRYG